MKQEQKEVELLLKDLCARLPYGVKVNITSKESKNRIVNLTVDNICNLTSGWWSECKPYLFPLSSMTEEQQNDCPIGETNLNIIKSNIGYGIIEMPWKLSYLFIDWLNKNNFDYRGLIEKGLAIDATGLNIY